MSDNDTEANTYAKKAARGATRLGFTPKNAAPYWHGKLVYIRIEKMHCETSMCACTRVQTWFKDRHHVSLSNNIIATLARQVLHSVAARASEQSLRRPAMIVHLPDIGTQRPQDPPPEPIVAPQTPRAEKNKAKNNEISQTTTQNSGNNNLGLQCDSIYY